MRASGGYPQVASAMAERTIAPTVEMTNRAWTSLVFHFMGCISFSMVFREQRERRGQRVCYVSECAPGGPGLQGFWGVAATASDGADSERVGGAGFLTDPQEMGGR